MSKCNFCGNELVTGDMRLGVCNHCYDLQVSIPTAESEMNRLFDVSVEQGKQLAAAKEMDAGEFPWVVEDRANSRAFAKVVREERP